jgi:sulfate permease, SulP family
VTRLIPGWIRAYRRAWLRNDAVAGIVVWSVVVPQAVAYAQIAGLPPQAGLMAAPGALIGYALLGTSRALVVSATTATAAVSAAAVGAIAGGDSSRFAALSATFALVVAVVFVGSGFLRVGGVIDLVSKPVMTGFLFGLGLTITVGQVPKLLGVAKGDGHFFQQAWDILSELGEAHWWTIAVGASSIVLLVALQRLAPTVPSTLVVLVLAIALSSLLDLKSHGVDVVGKLPSAFPKPAWPDFRTSDALQLIAPAFGILLLTTEAFGVSRTLAAADGSRIDANRELVAMGASNALAGLSQGFVQSGGASQTMAAENAGGKSQLASLVAAGLVLLTGAFLYPLFTNLPQATLGAIIVVAIARFYRVDELQRFARIRSSALVLSLTALVGVLLFGVLAGLLIAAGVSLILLVQRLSRPPLVVLDSPPGVIFARVDGPLFYGNAVNAKDRLLGEVASARPKPDIVILDLSESADLDVEGADALSDLHAALAKQGIELRLATVRSRAVAILRRSGLAERIAVESSLDEAAQELGHPPRVTPDDPRAGLTLTDRD